MRTRMLGEEEAEDMIGFYITKRTAAASCIEGAYHIALEHKKSISVLNASLKS